MRYSRAGIGAVLSALALMFAGLVPPRAYADPPVVRRVDVRGEGDSATIAVEGAFEVPTYDVRARDQGRVLVLEIEGAELPRAGIETHGSTSLVTGTVASSTAHGVRIEVQLTRAASYHARSSQGRVELIVERLGQPRAEEPPTEQSAGSAAVRDVHIERRNDRDRVIIDLTADATFRMIPGSRGPARLAIEGARIDTQAPRDVAGNPRGAVRRVRTRRESGHVVVEVERAEGAVGTAVREGRRIVWMFTEGTPETRPGSQTIARDNQEPAEGVEVETAEAAAFLTDVPMQIDGARERRRFGGRRVDLDFMDADIHNILRLLSEVGGVNVVTSDDVAGNVTIRMRDVPWDQALDVILQAKGLGMVRRGNLIRVALLETLEKEREAAIARRKQNEELAPIETRLIPASYATAEDLQPRVRELLSSRGSVSVDERTNVLIVRDILDNLDDVEQLIRTLDTQTPQVLVEARIVEATSQYLRDVGIQWGGDVTMSSSTGNPTGLGFPSNIGVAGGGYDGDAPTQGLNPFNQTVNPPNYAVNLPAITGTGQGGALGMTLGSVGGNVNLNVRLSAAEASGSVRIISSPRILTLDNHEAHIAQGTLIPYSQISAQGVQTAFQEARLELRVRPHVTADGSVAMAVRVTRNEPDFSRTSARGDPTILQREAQTELLVDDGNTAVIGGIYSRTTGRNLNQVPLLGDIPILGLLFQRRTVRDDRSELLIFLTPRIVNRSQALRR